MPEFPVSGLVFTLPDGACFRFQNLSTYKNLSGQGVREMDFAWWKENNDFYLMEVLSRGAIRRSNGNASALCEECTTKIIDSILLLAAIWLETDLGKQMQSEIGTLLPSLQQTPSINISILFVSSYDRSMFAPLADIINNKLFGKRRLFGIGRISILDTETLMREATNFGIAVRRGGVIRSSN